MEKQDSAREGRLVRLYMFWTNSGRHGFSRAASRLCPAGTKRRSLFKQKCRLARFGSRHVYHNSAIYTSTVAFFAAFAFALSCIAACFLPTPLVYSPTGVESRGEVCSLPGCGSYGVTSSPVPPLISDSTAVKPFSWFHGPTKSLSPYWLSPVDALKY